MSYYSGIVMRGFIRGLSKSILSGGQYDNLLHKMGKKNSAIGFALYLDLLEGLDRDRKNYDVDLLLIYDNSIEPIAVSKKVDELTKAGFSVCAQKGIPQKLRYKLLVDLTKEAK
jgi:ATP phosphoribosyltransferase regulatory subunit